MVSALSPGLLSFVVFVESFLLTLSYLTFLYWEESDAGLLPVVVLVVVLLWAQRRQHTFEDHPLLSSTTALTGLLYCVVVPLASSFALVVVVPTTLGVLGWIGSLPLSTIAHASAGFVADWNRTFLTQWVLVHTFFGGAVAGGLSLVGRSWWVIVRETASPGND
ncbi:hypothetical protein [Halomarina rubra]|uniref:Uncharacterized protein n=1 Tax=Halomarina rubra TaxID=2071873 RepID=A0ABD6AS39_9EURY|nr:hypothetical protein [Halomarina rubra]